MGIIDINEFSFSYAGKTQNSLQKINLTVNEGEILVLCGKSGSGKTTLLRCLKPEIAPVGEKSGNINFNLSSKDIGIVFQNPEMGLVTGSVIHDLAFHMENLGFNEDKMKKRMAETVGFFGIEPLLQKDVETLSGGQKQLISLCSALMTRPKVLLLDEPISQLDPISARELLDMVKKLNEEFGLTIIICEHRLDELIAIADKIALMDSGKVKYYGTPQEALREMWDKGDDALFIPQIARASLLLKLQHIALVPKQLRQMNLNINCLSKSKEKSDDKGKEVINLSNIVFSYKDSHEPVVKRLSLKIYKGEIFCLFGGNGSGKSTLLKILAGIKKPYLGAFKNKAGSVCYMPQSVSTYFSEDTVEKEIKTPRFDQNYYEYLVYNLELSGLLQRHPYDLSGGEQQKVILAAILIKKPDVIILDEPTKGLDPYSKQVMAKLLKQSGAAVIMATHDLEFAAVHADTCAMMFDGDIAYTSPPHEFFKENRYYTTAVSKALGQACEDIITYEDVLMWEKSR